MKQIRFLIVAGLLLALTGSVIADSDASTFRLNNRFRLSYDDNIYQVDKDSVTGREPTGSMRIVEELEMLVNMNLERTYLGLRYRPTVIWYDRREPNTADFMNDLDLNFIHNFSPILSLSLADTLQAGQLPELTDGEYVVREDDDNYYNSAIATLSYDMLPETRLDMSARYITLTYDTDSPAKENNDYYSIVGGLTLRQQLASRSTVMGDLRYQTLTYNKASEVNNRDAKTMFIGFGLEQTFSPQLLGNIRAGASRREYDDDAFDDSSQPYGELSMTFMPTPATRLTGAASYSIKESDVTRYMSQDRTYFSLSAAHDFTAKWSFYASGAYTLNAYDADYAMQTAELPPLTDADENSYLLSMRLSYQINRINWLEAGWQFVKLDSEVQGREEYTRNRIDIGWKIQLF